MKDNAACILCGSENTIVFHKNIIKCSECKNYFRINISDDIYKAYEKKLQMPSFFSSKSKVLHHLNFLKKNVDMERVKSVLEIGAGDGELVKRIRKKYPKTKITIIEPGIGFRKKLERIPDVSVISSFIENSKINEKFDLVIMSHVLEHLKDPKASLNYIYENYLENNGNLYIDIPNSDYELRSIDASINAPLIHLSFFTPVGIIRILNNSGFNDKLIHGNIYSTLPKKWINNQSKLGQLLSSSRKKTLRINLLKISNRVILSIASFIDYVFKITPKEKPIKNSDKYFNNIAVIAKKQ